MNYFEMWDLVRRNYGHTPQPDRMAFMNIITPELLMALFFEETGFQNIRQMQFSHQDWLKRWSIPVQQKHNPNGNHAVGFGQVERESIVLLRALGRKMGDFDTIPVQDIDLLVLKDDGKSVEICWRVLYGLWESGQFQNAQGLMNAFAGLPNIQKVPGIINCAALLSGFQRLPTAKLKQNDLVKGMQLMAGAFWNARHDGAFLRAFHVSQSDALKVGQDLQRIVAKNYVSVNPGPQMIKDLDAYVSNF